ncbi:hypothetical protein QQ045_015486 [Rhodiola kirilowii]
MNRSDLNRNLKMLRVTTRKLSSRSRRSPQPTSSTLISGNFHSVDIEKSNRSPLPANRDVLIGNLIRGDGVGDSGILGWLRRDSWIL